MNGLRDREVSLCYRHDGAANKPFPTEMFDR
jgi:hypothetical protein